MSALILAVVASICLAVVPQNLTNEYGNDAGVVQAATEVIDGHEYAVLDINGDTTLATIQAFTKANPYSKLVLQSDWLFVADEKTNAAVFSDYSFSSQGVILDLHGYTIKVSRTVTNITASVNISSHYVEVRDSSATGTGTIDATFLYVHSKSLSSAMKLVLRGGNFSQVHIDGHDNKSTSNQTALQVEVYGGTVSQFIKYNVRSVDTVAELKVTGGVVRNAVVENVKAGDLTNYQLKITNTTGNQIGNVKYDYDYYAVSTTPYASGAYNDVYGYVWEINITELSSFRTPADKTYYLWGRYADGWYEYLYVL